ncbi:hypothetical protein LEP1GSC016_2654 [Leptospira borgpetersenii serovar Hardjo-bovis str. Sponselee]|uniref:Uncharacterized protein n=1 Tax=Leptospira borgpetersenii serovar Hardjo-bovis str. Sponselee TaxID=1303729 RepID=M6BU70_LEPBO|nr:hypothetical protein LEP1GSC016_2654 [Leptospira borgpetersenii serovar Hardjo-bovis str. Sponselee]
MLSQGREPGKISNKESRIKPESRMEAQNVLPGNGSKPKKFLSFN